MSGARTVHVGVDLAVPLEQAWRAWTTNEGISSWLVDRMENEVVQGGRVSWVWEDMGFKGELDVTTVDEPRRLSFAQHRPGAPADVIDILFGARGESQTNVRLTQMGFVSEDPEEQAEAASSGWRIAFELMRTALEKYPGKPRASLLRMRKTGLAVQQVVPWLLTSGGRAMWLPKEAQGEDILLTTREALLPWSGTGLVEAKVFSGGPRETILALRGHSWTRKRSTLEKHVETFDAALERLEMLAAGKR